MYTYVCMYVCVYVCIDHTYVCMYGLVRRVKFYVSVYVFVCVCVYIIYILYILYMYYMYMFFVWLSHRQTQQKSDIPRVCIYILYIKNQ